MFLIELNIAFLGFFIFLGFFLDSLSFFLGSLCEQTEFRIHCFCVVCCLLERLTARTEGFLTDQGKVASFLLVHLALSPLGLEYLFLCPNVTYKVCLDRLGQSCFFFISPSCTQFTKSCARCTMFFKVQGTTRHVHQ